jgi:hypothetical protein
MRKTINQYAQDPHDTPTMLSAPLPPLKITIIIIPNHTKLKNPNWKRKNRTSRVQRERQ